MMDWNRGVGDLVVVGKGHWQGGETKRNIQTQEHSGNNCSDHGQKSACSYYGGLSNRITMLRPLFVPCGADQTKLALDPWMVGWLVDPCPALSARPGEALPNGRKDLWSWTERTRKFRRAHSLQSRRPFFFNCLRHLSNASFLDSIWAYEHNNSNNLKKEIYI
jgi:hypothetical protein